MNSVREQQFSVYVSGANEARVRQLQATSPLPAPLLLPSTNPHLPLPPPHSHPSASLFRRNASTRLAAVPKAAAGSCPPQPLPPTPPPRPLLLLLLLRNAKRGSERRCCWRAVQLPASSRTGLAAADRRRWTGMLRPWIAGSAAAAACCCCCCCLLLLLLAAAAAAAAPLLATGSNLNTLHCIGLCIANSGRYR